MSAMFSRFYTHVKKTLSPEERNLNFRMIFVAVFGAGIGYLTYELIYFLIHLEPRATISWGLAYFIGVLRQHYLHKKLTFKLETAPQGSLIRAYIMYSMSAAIGTVSNYILVETLSVHHRLAWAFCLMITASLSMVLLKRWVFKMA